MTAAPYRGAVTAFRRDRLTWVAYTMLAWFAYLQAAPGLLVPHLREELGLGYSVSGLHVAAFAAGALVSGLASAALDRRFGRRRVLWAGAALMAAGATGLTAGRVVEVTVGSVLALGLGGGLLLATVQAALADHHGELRAVALAEANVAASVAYVVLIGALSLTAALGFGWRPALLACLVVLPFAWWATHGTAMPGSSTGAGAASGPLPGTFWVAGGMLVAMTAAEWCVTAWGATFVQDAARLSADTAVSLMAGYFGGVVVGRVVGSALARRYEPWWLIVVALLTAAAGFVLLWSTGSAAQAFAGLCLLGLGLGNLFPMGLSVVLSLAPEQAASASGRAVMLTSAAVLLAPLSVGALADATSLSTALLMVPVTLAVAGTALAFVERARRRRRPVAHA